MIDYTISERFQGLNADSVPLTDIRKVCDSEVQVASVTRKNITPWVNLKAGLSDCCRCARGIYCRHQNAVIVKYYVGCNRDRRNE